MQLKKTRNSQLISPWMWLMACRSRQLLLHWSSNKLPAGALHWPGTAPLQLAAGSQGSPMKCEGEDGLWQDSAGFICSLGWELSCPGSAIEGWLGEPHPYPLPAATSQVGEGGQEAKICGLNNSPRATVFLLPRFPLLPVVSCRQMRRGRRRHSPRATHSRLCCRHPWSPRHRYSPSLLPSQPPRAPRASGGTGFLGVVTGKLQVIFSACISEADLYREYTLAVLISPSLSLWWQSLLCLVSCWLWLPSGNARMYPANASSLALVSGQTHSVPGE